MRWQSGVYFLAIGFMLVVTAKGPAGESTFTAIDFPGVPRTAGRDVAPDGDAYVGEYDDHTRCDLFGQIACHHGFLLKSGTFTAIDFPGASSTDAHGINARGDIVGVYRTAFGESHGYLLNKDGFTSFDFPDATGTSANGINARGDIVGGFCDGTIMPCPFGGEGHRGFLLSRGQFTTIDFPGASLTEAWKINSRGDIVGLYQDTSGLFHGFLLSEGQFSSIDVDFPGAKGTAALGINPRGDIVGAYCLALPCLALVNNHGFLLSGGQFTSFDFPGATGTVAFGINPRGDIAGAYCVLPCGLAFRVHAFLRSSGEGN